MRLFGAQQPTVFLRQIYGVFTRHKFTKMVYISRQYPLRCDNAMALNYPPNFSRDEMLESYTGTRLGIDNSPPNLDIERNILATADYLQKLRDHLGKPIKVLSCYRSHELNNAVGGSKTSAHMVGLAADIQVANVTPSDLVKEVLAAGLHFDQLIVEFGTWLHIGIPRPDAPNRNQILRASKKYGGTLYEDIRSEYA